MALERRRRKGDASDQDQAIADALSAQIAIDRRRLLQADAVKAAQLRAQRLEREADRRTATDTLAGQDSTVAPGTGAI